MFGKEDGNQHRMASRQRIRLSACKKSCACAAGISA
ncbi:hypothetical protein FAEPRAM212_02720 [Faecalibacterium prausnitzii M21/2]|uniref:Uncharacterized protein n=1 Tax=Faecalibacterium prausnitzii M21/2 TaxID=411485 RepID=A8SFD2_9FIRM|nr:hypothetical protein FAEPRAM212_02720 [Faecalibacterium prausnitzii M21/2]